MIMMKKHYGPVSDEILATVEEFWGFGLPKDYRQFLVQYNGGIPSKTFFHFKKIQQASVLDSFFGITRGSNSILQAAKDIGDRYPESMLPIADDVYGNRILLSVKGKDRGKVYFWDHELESEEGEEPTYDNLTLVADSFDEFVESLQNEAGAII